MLDVDGRYEDADGRKKAFVRRREDESDDAFAVRAMSICWIMSDITPLERVAMSDAEDWEKLPSTRWIEARHRTYPTDLHLRVTVMRSARGSSIGHLVVDHDDQQVADAWADRQDDGVYVSRAEDGLISKWQSAPWRLAHDIRGMGEQYDAALERSGIVVGPW